MYKVTITQDSYKDITLEYECQNEVFDLIEKVYAGDTKGNVKFTIEITEGGESNG